MQKILEEKDEIISSWENKFQELGFKETDAKILSLELRIEDLEHKFKEQKKRFIKRNWYP